MRDEKGETHSGPALSAAKMNCWRLIKEKRKNPANDQLLCAGQPIWTERMTCTEKCMNKYNKRAK